MNDWLVVTIPVSGGIREAVSNWLFENGCLGCQEEGDEIVAYFSKKSDAAGIKRQLQSYLRRLRELGFQVSSTNVQTELLVDRDWNAEWKKSYQPVEVSEKFIIKPSWVELSAPPGKYVIEIDPKQAFGTGTHATTQIMLKLLEKHLRPEMTVLDVGTGTGVLAIAATLLGAKKVVAVDNDPVATACAQENISRNLSPGMVQLCTGELPVLNLSQAFDLVLANITKNVILPLFPEFHRLLKCPGTLVLSGILQEEISHIRLALKPYPAWTVVEELRQEEWVGFVLRKEGEL